MTRPASASPRPQIGEMKRIVVMDLAKEGETPDPIVMINPEIQKYSDETVTTEEGLPVDPRDLLRRRAPGRGDGRLHRSRRQAHRPRDAKDRLAVCIQHELDHLDGVLYIDYLSRLKRDRVLKKFQKAEKLAKKAS